MDFDHILRELNVGHEYIADVLDKLENNATISEYFEKMHGLTNKDRYLALADEIAHCHDFFTCDKHPNMKIIDILCIRLCHNRFCPNCQKMIQATRLQRFRSFLLETSETHDLFHMVGTVKNVPAEKLFTTVSILFEAFARFVRFLRGTDKIKGIDLSPLGFEAAIRALEVTYNKRRNDYHPHLHIILALRKGIASELPKTYRNKFSYDTENGRRVWVRDFSELEIFFQKLWRLLIDQITARVYKFGNRFLKPIPSRESAALGFPACVKPHNKRKPGAITLKAIQLLGINDGYSVVVDPVENGHFVQVFKYAFKLQSEDAELMDFEQFRTLYESLLGRKTIQGYGAWYNLKPDDEFDETLDEFFDVFKAYLWQTDRPESANYTAAEVLELIDGGEYKVITRRKFHKSIEEVRESELYQNREQILSAGKRPALPPSMPDLCGAYYNYMRHRRESPLFADLRKVEDESTGTQLVVLNSEQLNFLAQIF